MTNDYYLINCKEECFVAAEESKGILLESGTNEMEIIEFGIGESAFGINVMKVREIINPIKVVQLPGTHPCVEGLIYLRGNVMPQINLGQYLDYEPSANPQHDRVIVAEFNQMKIAFRVQTVARIHRISWEQIEKPSDLQSGETVAVGIIKMGERIILLLDFEKIVMEINPDLGVAANKMNMPTTTDHSNQHIVIAEDSATLRHFIEGVLNGIGFTNLSFFENGAQAWNYLEDLAEKREDKFVEDIQLLITDIEMPQMDGHHLTRRVKEHKFLKKLPVVIFSSLINEDLFHKGKAVGADAQISKPDFPGLAHSLIDLALKP